MWRALLFGLVVLKVAVGQPPDTLWTRVYGGEGGFVPVGIRQTADDGYVIGHRYSLNGIRGAVTRLDSSGTLLWTREYRLSNVPRWYLEDICETSEEQIVFAGTSENHDALFAVKCDSNGDTLWSRFYNIGITYYVKKIEALENGSCVIVGKLTTSDSEGTFRAMELVVDSAGNTVSLLQGAGDDWGWYGGTSSYYGDLGIWPGFGILGVTYTFQHTIEPFGRPVTYRTINVVLIDGDGLRTPWLITRSIFYNLASGPLVSAEAGDYICINARYMPDDNLTSQLWHYDQTANPISSEQIALEVLDMATSNQGRVLTLSTSVGQNSDIVLSHWNADGSLDWLRTFDLSSNDEAISIESTNDGGHVILVRVGESGFPDRDFAVIKTDPNNFLQIDGTKPRHPSSAALFPAYPNPFNPTTEIRFELSRAGHTTLRVFDLLGREVAVLIDEQLSAGSYTKTFDGSSVPSGVYLYRLETGVYSETKKMVLLK